MSVVDIFPTLLSLAGVPVPSGIDGRSLLLPKKTAPRAAYSETLYAAFPKRAAPGHELASVRYEGWKLLSGPGRLELYDLRTDPGETHNLASSQPDRVASLLAQLHHAAGEGGPRTPQPLELSPKEKREHLERLRALGYVE